MRKNITKVAIKDILEPKDGEIVEVKDNWWWVVTEDDEVLLYDNRVWQCNSDERVAKRIYKKLYPDCNLKLIKRAFATFHIS